MSDPSWTFWTCRASADQVRLLPLLELPRALGLVTQQRKFDSSAQMQVQDIFPHCLQAPGTAAPPAALLTQVCALCHGRARGVGHLMLSPASALYRMWHAVLSCLVPCPLGHVVKALILHRISPVGDAFVFHSLTWPVCPRAWMLRTAPTAPAQRHWLGRSGHPVGKSSVL